jgi:hypothetical protein
MSSGGILDRIRAHSKTLSGRVSTAPEWGLDVVYFRRQTAGQADDFSKDVKKNAARASANLIIAVACDADGKALFSDDAPTMAALVGADAAVVLRLISAAAGADATVEDEKKD